MFQQNILNQDFNLFPARMGLDAENLLPTQKRFKGHGGESQDIFQIMRRIIYFDRQRRKAIMEGTLRDIEHFPKFNEDFFNIRRSQSQIQNSMGDPSIVSNGVQHALSKMQKLTAMFGELMTEQDSDLNRFIRAENTRMLQAHGNSNKIYEKVPVCG